MTEWEGKNLLCFGDNLIFLSDRQLFPDGCIDLIYLDPPFNSQQTYNVLFKEASGTPEAAQFKAFEDTWRWDLAANEALTKITTSDPSVPAPLVDLTKTFMNFLKPSPMMAYLVQMAIRLVHMHRVLKPTGSLYLHCDPTASHYLKLVLDAVFGPENFLNEITWKRTHAHGSSKRYGPIHDVILFYGKSDQYKWTGYKIKHDPGYIENHFRCGDVDGRLFQPISLTGSGVRYGDSGKPWKGIDPTKVRRHWAIPGEVIARLNLGGTTVQEKLDALDAANRIYWPRGGEGTPRLKWFADELEGIALPDVITDIPPIGAQAAERMGYPTQKPLELLKRIIAASSNPGDVIMDPFCGCGTTIDAVETLNRENPDKPPRRWIGIDITHLSLNLIKHRLSRFAAHPADDRSSEHAKREVPPPEYEVINEPASVAAAEALAQKDRHQFELWALGLIAARPAGGRVKKGPDKGIDGVRYFQDEQKNGAMITKKMLVQVKSGHVTSTHIRDLAGAMTRERAEMAVFLTLEDPSKPMRSEAAAAGTYVSPWDKQAYPKIQILTIAELLGDPHRPNPRCLQVPAGFDQHTLPEPPKHRPRTAKQRKLEFNGGQG